MSPLDLLLVTSLASVVLLLLVGGRSWSGWLEVVLYTLQLGLLVEIASSADLNERPFPRTWASQPRLTTSQSALYRSMVTFIRPPPDAIR